MLPLSETAPVSWAALAAELRPFVARRLPAQVDQEDVLQDVFLRVHRGLPMLRQKDRFGPFVYRIARTAIADHLRGRKRHPLAGTAARDQEVADEGEEPAEGPGEENTDSAENLLSMYVAGFVAHLPSPYREALTLTELGGMGQREGAEMLGISVSTMKSRVQRGRQKLRALFDTWCNIEIDRRGRVISCVARERSCACGEQRSRPV